MKKSNFSVNSIDVYPSRMALIAYACLGAMLVLTLVYSDLTLMQVIVMIAFIACWWGYEYSQCRRRGRLVLIQRTSDERVILHYAQGVTVEGVLSPASFANRWFVCYRVGDVTHILCQDALQPDDYRRLTVSLIWCR